MKKALYSATLECGHSFDTDYGMPHSEDILWCFRCDNYRMVKESVCTKLLKVLNGDPDYCKNGHDKTADNGYWYTRTDEKKEWKCRLCRRDRQQKHNRRSKFVG